MLVGYLTLSSCTLRTVKDSSSPSPTGLCGKRNWVLIVAFVTLLVNLNTNMIRAPKKRSTTKLAIAWHRYNKRHPDRTRDNVRRQMARRRGHKPPPKELDCPPIPAVCDCCGEASEKMFKSRSLS